MRKVEKLHAEFYEGLKLQLLHKKFQARTTLLITR